MTQDEIREAVNLNNRLIEEAMKPNQFVLNNIVRDLLNENMQLQKICNHEFIKGYCKYCDLMEE